MINDYQRNKFFHDALHKSANGKIVLDMGTGTGILSYYALKAGAKFVYSIERNAVSAAVAEALLSKKFDRSKFKVIVLDFQSDEIDHEINHKIDVLVSETIGPFLFDQHILHTWEKIQKFADPDLISIPDAISIDLHIWNKNLKKFMNAYKQFGLKNIDRNVLIDDDLYQSLLEVEKNFPIVTIRQINLNHHEYPGPDKIIENFFDYKFKELSKFIGFSNAPIKRGIELKNPRNILGFMNKISFEGESIYLKDAKYMPWKYVPFIFTEDTGHCCIEYKSISKWAITKS